MKCIGINGLQLEVMCERGSKPVDATRWEYFTQLEHGYSVHADMKVSKFQFSLPYGLIVGKELEIGREVFERQFRVVRSSA